VKRGTLRALPLLLVAAGAAAFLLQLSGPQPARAWQALLINFLLWSSIAQGGVLFSALMRTVRARWTGALSPLSESFAAFFPVSLALFPLLLLGREHLFPWLHADLHGKEAWLNLPFLFTRDLAGLLVLYGLGGGYALLARRQRRRPDPEAEGRLGVLAILYLLAFALVLSLLGFDLLMAADPHWYSTLFGGYTFVKAIYLGLGGLIVLAAALHLDPVSGLRFTEGQFHDLGKLFFAFCLVWADFFYAQLVVIWYGNIPEESAWVIQRTMAAPWNRLAWTVFLACFVIPFLVLLNRRVKTRPRFMLPFCSAVIAGLWLEHLLILGPALFPGAAAIPVGIPDLLISAGFLGLMALALGAALARWPIGAAAAGEEGR
jgi:hypothetical protein